MNYLRKGTLSPKYNHAICEMQAAVAGLATTTAGRRTSSSTYLPRAALSWSRTSSSSLSGTGTTSSSRYSTTEDLFWHEQEEGHSRDHSETIYVGHSDLEVFLRSSPPKKSPNDKCYKKKMYSRFWQICKTATSAENVYGTLIVCHLQVFVV